MRKTKLMLALLILASSAQSVPSHTENTIAMTNDYSACDWPMRDRTTDGNRILPAQCAPGLGQLETVWEQKLNGKDQQITDVVAVDNRVYLSTDNKDRNVVYIECLNTDDGSLIWRSKFSLKYLLDLIAFKEMLFFYSDKAFYCLDSFTGEILWKKTLTSRITRLTYYKDSIILCNADEGVESIDPFTGYTQWITPFKDKIWPADISVNVDSLYAIVSSDLRTDKSYIYKIDLSSKMFEIIFEMEGQGLYNLNIFDDYLCFDDGDGMVTCYDMGQKVTPWTLKTNGYLGIRKMIYKNGLLYFNEAGSFDFAETYGSSVFCIDIETGKVIWQNDHGIDYFSEMFMYGNIVMYGTRYKRLMVANAITGQIINKTVEDNSTLYPLAISKKHVFVSKWNMTSNSLVCMREKVCK